MKNKRIVTFLKEVLESEKKWVDYGQVLVEGVNIDNAEEPLRNANFELLNWLSFNQSEFESYPWFSELKQSHNDLHQSYSVLYLETMRIYKPKKLEELIISFTDLEKKYESFEKLLDSMSSDIHSLPRKQIKQIAKQLESGESLKEHQSEELHNNYHKPKDLIDDVKELSEDHDFNDKLKMQTIDISNTDNDDLLAKPLDEVSQTEEVDTAYETETSLHDAIEKVRQLKMENNIHASSMQSTKWASNIEQSISLKEKTIEQLNKEKELIQLELTNLEERQTLNKQSVEQFEQTYHLKQQEIEQENLENQQLVDFKIENRSKLNNEIDELKDKKSGLAKFIQDLEKEHEADSIDKNDDAGNTQIQEQLEELKHNKAKGVEQLLQQLNLRKVDLKKLKDQLILLEEEVEQMESELTQKQQDLAEIDEKEQIKRNEKIEKQTEREKAIQTRLEVINDKQDELYLLIEESNNKKNARNAIDSQIDELKRNNQLIEDANNALLVDIEQQQKQKEEKRAEIDNLKSQKLAETDALNAEITRAEQRLDELRADLSSSKKESLLVD